jgi:hypothetical protein
MMVTGLEASIVSVIVGAIIGWPTVPPPVLLGARKQLTVFKLLLVRAPLSPW